MTDDERALAVGRAVLTFVEALGIRTTGSDALDALVPIEVGARIAATSVRVVRDAIRSGELTAYGGQRDRSIRRSEIERWIEGRRLKPVASVDDRDIEARMRRLAVAR